MVVIIHIIVINMTNIPKYPYPISWNPTHQGHLNIAKKFYNETWSLATFVLWQNPNKDEGLLSIEQRKEDLLLTLQLDSFFQHFDIENLIKILDPSDYKDLILHSECIIRWIRWEQDLNEAIALSIKWSKLTWIESSYIIDKTHFVYQDTCFQNISSSKYLKVMQEVITDYDQIPSKCQQYWSYQDFLKLHSINTSQTIVTPEIKSYMEQQIHIFFEWVSRL